MKSYTRCTLLLLGFLFLQVSEAGETFHAKIIYVIPTGTVASPVSDPSETIFMSGEALSDLLKQGAVTLQANSDIFFYDIVHSETSNELSLQAGRSVNFSSFSELNLNGGSVVVTINDENASSQYREEGPAKFEMGEHALLQTQGGNISIDVGTFNNVQEGIIHINSGLLLTNEGNIDLHGYGSPSCPIGISLNGFARLETTGTGSINLTGQGSSGQESSNFGILCAGYEDVLTLKIKAEQGPIQMTGIGGGTETGRFNHGIYIRSASVTTESGRLFLDGAAGPGIQQNSGVLLSTNDSVLSTVDGNILLKGQGGPSGDSNSGVRLDLGAELISTGTGTITIEGTSGGSTSMNSGVIISTYSTGITSHNGDITIKGTAHGSSLQNQGVRVESAALIQSTGTGHITLEGAGSQGLERNDGVAIVGKNTMVLGVDGDVQITGSAFASGSHQSPILIEYPSNISTSGTGAVSYNPIILGN